MNLTWVHLWDSWTALGPDLFTWTLPLPGYQHLFKKWHYFAGCVLHSSQSSTSLDHLFVPKSDENFLWRILDSVAECVECSQLLYDTSFSYRASPTRGLTHVLELVFIILIVFWTIFVRTLTLFQAGFFHQRMNLTSCYPPVFGDMVSNSATLLLHLLHLQVIVREFSKFLHHGCVSTFQLGHQELLQVQGLHRVIQGRLQREGGREEWGHIR